LLNRLGRDKKQVGEWGYILKGGVRAGCEEGVQFIRLFIESAY